MTFSLDEVEPADDAPDASPSNISCRLRIYSTAQRNVSTLLTLRLLLDEEEEEDRPPLPSFPLLLLLQKEVGMCWRRTAKPMLTCLTRLRSRALRRATEAGGGGGST